MAVRPESIQKASGNAGKGLQADIYLREDLGAEEIIYLNVGGTSLTMLNPSYRNGHYDVGDQIGIGMSAQDIFVFEKGSDSRIGRGKETSMSEIKVENLTKRFGKVVAVDDLTFSFPEGKVTCLLGPSGCGKTTLLRMIAGLETPTQGHIYFGDLDVTALPPRKRNIGMVFQSSVVYRGISVYKNIELPLLKRNCPKRSAESGFRRSWSC